MLRKVVTASAFAAALVLSGCSGDSAGEDRLEAQHAIDSGDSATAISILEAKDPSTLTDADKMTLASAYMQNAGVSLMDVVSKLDTEEGTDSTFASVANDIIGDSGSAQTAQKVKSVDKAILYYESMSSTSYSAAPSYKAVDATEVLEGVKLYLGMAYFSKVTMLLSFFGDVDALEDGSVSTYKDSYKATEEALKCIYDSDCTAVTNSYISTDLNNTSPTVFVINVNGNSFYRLATEGTSTTTKGQMIIADYKTIDDVYSYATQSSGNYTLSSDDMPFGSSYLFDEQVLDALNGAYKLVLDQAPDDIKTDMEDKFKEIDTDLDYSISMSEIRAYMAKNN